MSLRMSICEKVFLGVCGYPRLYACVGVSVHMSVPGGACPGGEASPQGGGARANRINTH